MSNLHGDKLMAGWILLVDGVGIVLFVLYNEADEMNQIPVVDVSQVLSPCNGFAASCSAALSITAAMVRVHIYGTVERERKCQVRTQHHLFGKSEHVLSC